MSVQYLHLDAQFVKSEVAKLIEAHPELAEDDALRLDMIEAETSVHAIAERAFNAKREAETYASALKERESDMATRRARFERQADAMKRLIQSVMQAAQLTKLPLPEVTISILAPRRSVNVLSVDELAQGYFETVRKPNTQAIKSDLEKGLEVPGAELTTGSPGVMFRTK